jgi:Zn-dependent peptidase ImmA (M78 family)
MPADAMHADAPHPPALEKVIVLAHKWGVPPATIAHRLHKLELLSEWLYRKIRDQITEHGADGERTPAGAHRETSSLLQQVFASLHGRGITKHKIAGSLPLYPTDLDDLTFGLASVGLDGAVNSEHLRPRLTLVSSGQ